MILAPLTKRRGPGRVAAFGATALVVGLALTTATPAWAEDPSVAYNGVVVNTTDELTHEQELAVQEQISRLKAATGVSLKMIYIDSYDGANSTTWLNDVYDNSGLSENGLIMGIAIDDAYYDWVAGFDFPLNDSQLENVVTSSVQPALSKHDYEAAGIGAANGIAKALGTTLPGSTSPTGGDDATSAGVSPAVIIAFFAILVVLAALALVFWMRSRSRRRAKAKDTHTRLGQALTTLDAAIEQAQQDLGFAAASFEAGDLVSYQQRYDELRTRTTAAMQRFGALEQGSLDQATLDQHTAEVEGLRTAATTLSSQLAALTQIASDPAGQHATAQSQLGAVQTKVQDAGQVVARLQASFVGPGVQQAVANFGQAQAALQVAQATLTGTQNPTPSVVVREIGALSQASAAVDLVTQGAQSLDTAANAVQATSAQLSSEISMASTMLREASSAPSASQLNLAIAEAQQALPNLQARYDPQATQQAIAQARGRLSQRAVQVHHEMNAITPGDTWGGSGGPGGGGGGTDWSAWIGGLVIGTLASGGRRRDDRWGGGGSGWGGGISGRGFGSGSGSSRGSSWGGSSSGRSSSGRSSGGGGRSSGGGRSFGGGRSSGGGGRSSGGGGRRSGGGRSF